MLNLDKTPFLLSQIRVEIMQSMFSKRWRFKISSHRGFPIAIPQQSVAMSPPMTPEKPPDGGHNSSRNTNYIPQQSVAMNPHDT